MKGDEAAAISAEVPRRISYCATKQPRAAARGFCVGPSSHLVWVYPFVVVLIALPGKGRATWGLMV